MRWWNTQPEVAVGIDDERKRYEEDGANGVGRRVDVELSCPIRDEGEGAESEALTRCEVEA